MSYDVSVWTEVADAIKNGRALTDKWSSHVIVEHLCRISSSVANILYVDLCTLQLASSGEITEPQLHILNGVIDVHNSDDVKRFCSLVIDNGRIVEMVADCVELYPTDRKKKWDSEERERRHEATKQRQRRDVTRQFSEFCIRSRIENANAYNAVRRRLTASFQSNVGWKLVIVQTPERVGRYDSQFWRELQTAKCTIEEKQALCHKLELVQIQSTCPANVIAHKSRLMQQLFSSGMDAAPRRKRGFLCWRRLFRIN